MLGEEARWLGKEIYQREPRDVFPMCNMGSGTLSFRQEKQPHIERHIIRPARDVWGEIVHVDQKAGEGIDITGDVADPGVLRQIRSRRIRSVLCSNMLEHTRSREVLAGLILDILPEGGYLFVTVPHRFPYHPDPIDTLYRPDADELVRLFPGTETRSVSIVDCGNLLQQESAGVLTLGRMLLRLCLPFYRYEGWKSTATYLPYLVRRFSVTCAVLQKGVRVGGAP